MNKEFSTDAPFKNNTKNCPVTGLPLLTFQEYSDIHMKGDYYISLWKIGESIVYISARGNLQNYDVEQFNKVMDDFCKAAQVNKPYVQIRDVTNLSGRIPLRIMQKQGLYFFKEQDAFLAVISIKDPSWMKLFVKYGARFFSPKTRFISAKNYADALQKAQKVLQGDETSTHQERGIVPAFRGFRFEDVQFDPQWVYQNPQTGFTFKIGVIPGSLQFSKISGAMSMMEDVKQTVALINKISTAYPFVGKSFIVVDMTHTFGNTSISIKKAFVSELKKLWNAPGEFKTVHVIISPDKFHRISGKLFFSLLGQKVMAASTTKEAFRKINDSFYSVPKRRKYGKSIMITKADLDEISHVCSYLLLDEKGEAISIEVSPENPLYEIAEMLELVRADLNEQRKTEQRKSAERLQESEKNRRQLLSMMEDAEAAKEALIKTKAEMTAVMENTTDSIWSVNTNYEIIYINEVFKKAYKASYGVTLEPGIHILDTVPHSMKNTWKERYDRVFNGENWVIVDKLDIGDTSVYTEVSAHPICNNNKVVGASIFGRNITERIRAEETRQQLEVVKNTMQIKQNFLANMSHEIRTPLTGILGMTELLEQTNLSDVQKDFVTTMKVSGVNLKEIINQVLDYSKIEAGKIILKPQVFEFVNLIHETGNLYKNMVRNDVSFQTNIDPEIPKSVSADKPRIAQVLNNISSNAVKFTSEGSITLNTQLLSSGKNSNEVIIKIEVTDTGKGIPKEKQENLFAPFSQIEDNDRRDYEGTGLGLTISKELIHLMGGEIGFESTPGKGSTFWFTFPATIAQNTHQNIHTSHATSNNHKLKILLAEDKLVNQKVINLMLTSQGHKVSVASNGQQATDLYQPNKFDLILMDIQMPVMDGVAATQYLKENYKNLPPVVGLSANAFEGDREKYMVLGMDEYLTKPVKKDDFEVLIGKLFQQRPNPQSG